MIQICVAHAKFSKYSIHKDYVCTAKQCELNNNNDHCVCVHAYFQRPNQIEKIKCKEQQIEQNGSKNKSHKRFEEAKFSGQEKSEWNTVHSFEY